MLQKLFLLVMMLVVLVGLPVALAALFHFGVPALGTARLFWR